MYSTRNNSNVGHSWFQEQLGMINTASTSELAGLCDTYDERVRAAVETISANYNGVNVMKDAKKMMENPVIMQEYKTELLGPILDEMRHYPTSSSHEASHLRDVADQLENAWDESRKSFLIQESYQVSNYLPLSTLDFPALIKQYIRFLGKDIIPVQTASSVNIEQRIFIKYLVNNQTGEEFETPAIYWMKDEDGAPLWRKLWNAGKGYRLRDGVVLPLATIYDAPNKKFSLYDWLIDDAGTNTTITPTVRTRLSYDFHIQYVEITIDGETSKVRLPGGGIQVDIQTGGVFLNGGITETMRLPVVDSSTNKPTGDFVSISDRLSGVVDFIKGTVTATSCGVITGIYLSGHVSNETNTRTIGFREYPEIRKFLIDDGCRFQLPFTVEDFAEANSSLNFNLYNRLVQELVTAQEMFEDEYILETLDAEYEKYDGFDSDVFALESYTYTEYVDFDPTSISPNFAGDPYEYRANALQNAIASTIYELCDRGKLDNLGFVIYGNPKVTRLIQKFVTWTVSKSTEIGGVKMNHSFGVMTDTDVPIRVVSSNRVDAYTVISAYQDDAIDGDFSKEYFLKIVAYPLDKFHISYKHLRFARHLTNSPENAAYADAQNPGGAAVMVTTSAQYKTISIQGIQGRIICMNSRLVPDNGAGLIVTETVDGGEFNAVTGITGVPENGSVGDTTLDTSVVISPLDATNQTIVWTVKTVGTTGATIAGNVLTTTDAGTVVVTATIANGTSTTTDYVEDFSITITE